MGDLKAISSQQEQQNRRHDACSDIAQNHDDAAVKAIYDDPGDRAEEDIENVVEETEQRCCGGLSGLLISPDEQSKTQGFCAEAREHPAKPDQSEFAHSGRTEESPEHLELPCLAVDEKQKTAVNTSALTAVRWLQL